MSRARCLILALALGAGHALLHWRTADFMSAQFQVDWHRAIIEGRGPYPDQYRVLTYWLAEGLIRGGVPFQLAHELLRGAFTAAALYAFARYLSRWFDSTQVVAGVLVLATGLALTCAYEAMQPTDPLNLLVFALALQATAAGRDWLAIPLVAVGTLNREAALLVPVLWFALRGRPALPYALLSLAAGSAVYVGLRFALGQHAPYAPTSPWHFWRANLEDWQTWVIVIAFFAPVGVLVGRQSLKAPMARGVWVAAAVFVASATVGYVREIRLLLPALLVTIAPAMWTYRASDRASQP